MTDLGLGAGIATATVGTWSAATRFHTEGYSISAGTSEATDHVAHAGSAPDIKELIDLLHAPIRRIGYRYRLLIKRTADHLGAVSDDKEPPSSDIAPIPSWDEMVLSNGIRLLLECVRPTDRQSLADALGAESPRLLAERIMTLNVPVVGSDPQQVVAIADYLLSAPETVGTVVQLGVRGGYPSSPLESVVGALVTYKVVKGVGQAFWLTIGRAPLAAVGDELALAVKRVLGRWLGNTDSGDDKNEH